MIGIIDEYFRGAPVKVSYAPKSALCRKTHASIKKFGNADDFIDVVVTPDAHSHWQESQLNYSLLYIFYILLENATAWMREHKERPVNTQILLPNVLDIDPRLKALGLYLDSASYLLGSPWLGAPHPYTVVTIDGLVDLIKQYTKKAEKSDAQSKQALTMYVCATKEDEVFEPPLVGQNILETFDGLYGFTK